MRKNRNNKKRAFTLIEIMIAVCLIAGLAAVVLTHKVKQMQRNTAAAEASILQNKIQNTYESWTEGGGRHDSATSGTLTLNLFRTLIGQESASGVAKSGGSGWVDEQIRMIAGPGGTRVSVAGAIRLKDSASSETVLTGNDVTYDGRFIINFTPGSSSSGTWSVQIDETKI